MLSTTAEYALRVTIILAEAGAEPLTADAIAVRGCMPRNYTRNVLQSLGRAGFVEVHTEDASDWYRRRARKEYELLQGELQPQALKLLGQQAAEHFIENWRAMVVVCDSGEMRQGYSRGRKPGGD